MVVHRIEILEGNTHTDTYIYIFTEAGTVSFLLFPLPYVHFEQ